MFSINGKVGRGKYVIPVMSVWIISVILLWPAHGALLGWDEVDYVNAAKLGIKANMLEQYSLSPASYLEFARAKSSGKSPNLPSDYDEDRDTLLLRHYHPPLVVLILAIIPDLNSERAARSVQLLGVLMLTLAIFFSYFSISSSPGWQGILIVSLFAIWMNISLFRTISFHGWAAVWIITTTTTLYLCLKSWTLLRGISLCVSLALGLLTLETGIFILVIVLAWLTLQTRLLAQVDGNKLGWREIGIGVCLVGLTVFAVWPGSILKASLVKIPALYAYRIVQGQEYANVAGLWRQLIDVLSPMVLVIISCVWVFFKDRNHSRYLTPVVIIGILYVLILARFALSPGYLLPGFAPLICFVGMMADQIQSKLGRLILSTSVLALVLATGAKQNLYAGDEKAREDVKWLGEIMINRQALVDGGHIYRHYLGQSYNIRAISVSYDAKSLLFRERGEYRKIKKDDLEEKLLVIQKRPQQVVGGSAMEMLSGCSQVDRNHIVVWDCRNGDSNLKARGR